MILLLFFSIAQARWQAPATCPDNLSLAQEVVRYKLSGASQMQKSKCVDQTKFSNVRANDQFIGEESVASVETVKTYSIKEVKEIETNMGKEVQVSVQLEISPTGSRNEVMSFIRMDEAPNKADFGCAMPGSQEMQGVYILSSCK